MERMVKKEAALQRSSFWHKHRFALFFFFFFVLYNMLFSRQHLPWRVDDVTYVFHAVDYRCGFATKLLPGAVFRALFGPLASRFTASIYETVLILLFFAGVSIFLERFLLEVSKMQRLAALFLLLFFITGAFTFSIYVKELGLLDVNWLYLSLLFFCFLDHKYLRYLIPLLYVASIMVHYSAVLCTVVLFSVLLLYRTSVESDRRERRVYLAVFTVSLLLTAGAFVFFVLNEARSLCSMEQFHEIMQSNKSTFFDYYDYAFYNIYNGEQILPDFVAELTNPLMKMLLTVYYRVRFNIFRAGRIGGDVALAIIAGVAVILPVLAFLYAFHLRRYRAQTNGFSRLCTLLMMAQFPFTVCVSMLFSVDINRWLTLAFLGFFSCVLYVSKREKAHLAELLRQAETFMSMFPVRVYYLAYATISFWPYS